MRRDTNRGHHGQQVAAINARPDLLTGFDTFFRTEYRHVVRLVCRIGATMEEAEDAAATAMTIAYRCWATLINPAAWVRTTALRQYLRDLHRNQADARRAIRAYLPPPDEARSPGQAQYVVSLLRALPPAQLEVMALAFDGYTPTEIAELLDRPAATVRSNLRQARLTLQRMLNATGNMPTPASTPMRQTIRNGGRHD